MHCDIITAVASSLCSMQGALAQVFIHRGLEEAKRRGAYPQHLRTQYTVYENNIGQVSVERNTRR